MKLDIKSLPKSPELLAKMVLDLASKLEAKEKIIEQSKTELARYKQKYACLIEEICLAKQQRFSSASEKNILQSDLFDEAGIELPSEVTDQLDDEVTVKSHTRKNHPVRRPLPAYLPRVIIIHDISEAEKACACGEHLTRFGEEVSEQLKYTPAKISVIQHVRPKYACRPCQANVKIAPMPTVIAKEHRNARINSTYHHFKILRPHSSLSARKYMGTHGNRHAEK